MLRFFRTIRQRLLTENRLGRYLLYAVGEILLVVIGILAALQVDNWNERRKDVLQEREYLENLKSEMVRTRDQVNHQIGVNNRQLANARYILSVMDNKESPDSAIQLALALQEVPWFVPINITRDVWTELIATGNIGLLRDGDLKDRIAEFYSSLDFHLQIEKECQVYYLGFRQAVSPIFKAADWVSLTEYLQNGEGDNMDLKLSPAYLRKGDELTLDLPPLEDLRNELNGIDALNGYLSDLIACREVGRRTFEAYGQEIESILGFLNKALN